MSLINQLVKKQLPQAKESMEEILDQLFLNVAEAKKVNPFELFLVISNQKDQILGKVYNPKKKALAAIDVGELVEDMLEQLQDVPAFLKEYIDDFLETSNISVTQLFAQELGNKRLVAKYNKDSELILIEIDGKNKKIVDLTTIIDKLDF